jgi:hypothetical protein
MNVLAVVAHPDDEVIGCGGTLAKLRENGNDVRVVMPLKRNDPRRGQELGQLNAIIYCGVHASWSSSGDSTGIDRRA